MDAKELANETYVKRMKIWETEDDRDIGESFYHIIMTDNPINEAKRLYNLMSYACVEVVYTENNEDDEEVLFHISSDAPKGEMY